ncbi:MAG: hypothetical protein QOD29_286, partial [Alphaproteobacteria bacterium]|nr:hypothetical protein [Alphaproteobacteria bacterium]
MGAVGVNAFTRQQFGADIERIDRLAVKLQQRKG